MIESIRKSRSSKHTRAFTISKRILIAYPYTRSDQIIQVQEKYNQPLPPGTVAPCTHTDKGKLGRERKQHSPRLDGTNCLCPLPFAVCPVPFPATWSMMRFGRHFIFGLDSEHSWWLLLQPPTPRLFTDSGDLPTFPFIQCGYFLFFISLF